MLKEARQAVIKWAQTTTLHGLPRIFLTKYSGLKLIWITVFLFFSTVSALWIMRIVNGFISYKVTTQISQRTEPVSFFPMITICNSYKFFTNSGIEFAKKVLIDYNITNLVGHANLANGFSPSNYQLGILMQLMASNNPNISDSIRATWGSQFDSFVISCSFNLNDCSVKDWSFYMDQVYGNCFSFNSHKAEKLKTVSEAGILGGSLVIELFLGDKSQIVDGDLKMATGAHIFINNNTGSIDSSTGLKISPGFRTYIAIKKSKVKQLPYPYSNCVQDLNHAPNSDYLDFFVDSNYSYSRTKCFRLVAQKEIIKKCNCHYPLLTTPPVQMSVSQCSSLNETGCVWNTLETITDPKLVSEYTNVCPLECERYFFSYSESFEKYPSKNYGLNLAKQDRVARLFNRSVTVNDLRESLASAVIYFADTSLSLVSEAPKMTIDGLVSNVGGVLGIFVGASILFIVEIAEIVIEFLYVIFIKTLTDKIF